MGLIVIYNVEEIFTLIRRDLFHAGVNGHRRGIDLRDEYLVREMTKFWFYYVVNEYRILNLKRSTRYISRIPMEIGTRYIQEIHPAYDRLLYKLLTSVEGVGVRQVKDIEMRFNGDLIITFE